MHKNTINLIEEAYDKRYELNNSVNLTLKTHLKDIINNIITELEIGSLRVATPLEYNPIKWQIHTWIKKAILLSFIINDNKVINGSFCNYLDKIPGRASELDIKHMQANETRIVPPAYIRSGSYIGKNTIIMPSFINIGAFVDEGTMIDSWATIGSCAQIGKNVHISSGVNIGGVLEPMHDSPTIIEDYCFIGANSAIVEGIIVEKNSVIAAGTILTKSTKIYDREKNTITYGKIPSGSVVIPGNLIAENYKYSINCAIIAKMIDAKTLNKTEINQILRSCTLTS